MLSRALHSSPEQLDILRECEAHVSRLRSAANYMGYDALGSVYDEMLSEVDGFASQAVDAEAVQIDQFLQTTLVGGMARIRELFPNAELLESIETEELTVAADETEEEPAIAQEAEASELPAEGDLPADVGARVDVRGTFVKVDAFMRNFYLADVVIEALPDPT